MLVKAQRLRRFDKRSKFYPWNKVFQTDVKNFQRKMGNQLIVTEDVPSTVRVKELRDSIWGKQKGYKQKVIGQNTLKGKTKRFQSNNQARHSAQSGKLSNLCFLTGYGDDDDELFLWYG